MRAWSGDDPQGPSRLRWFFGGFFSDREPSSSGVRRWLGVSAFEKEASSVQESWEESEADLCDQ